MEKIIIENARELISMVNSQASEEHKQKMRKLKVPNHRFRWGIRI